MIVVMNANCSEDNIDAVKNRLTTLGLSAHLSRGEDRVIVGVVGKTYPDLKSNLEYMEGVIEVLTVSSPFKLPSRDFHPEDTVIRVGDVEIGGGEPVVMAGPCAVESWDQLLETALGVRDAGANILRGGAYKPRTSPYSFRGMGEAGLELLARAREETGMPVITEVMTTTDVEIVAQYADILQIGARNMQNFNLLDEVGKCNRAVMLKRGLSATIEEWLLAAEYILAQGNPDVMLCERGIRTFEKYTRNTLDLSAIPVIQRLSHLPIIADPSHATGKWYLVTPMALAAAAAGADGLMVEVHPKPEEALCDGAQALRLDNFALMMDRMRTITRPLQGVYT